VPKGKYLGAPAGVAVARDGTVFAIRMGGDALWRFAPGREPEQLFGEESAGRGKVVDALRGILVDAAGRVYLSGARSNSVVRYAPPPPPPAPAPAPAGKD
jgi:streptogramin lyase